MLCLSTLDDAMVDFDGHLGLYIMGLFKVDLVQNNTLSYTLILLFQQLKIIVGENGIFKVGLSNRE